MTERELKNLACELASLSVFRGILRLPPMAALLDFLSGEGGAPQRLRRYGEFVSALGEDGYCLSDFLLRAVYADENPYVRAAARGRALTPVMTENAAAEFDLLSRLTHLTAEELCASFAFGGHIPRFDNRPVNFRAVYADRLREIGRHGYGVFALHGMFRVSGEEIVPVEAADTISLDSFIGYEAQRQKVFDNTRALIAGKPAANVLLYGDAGTGKSSTVKACANFFFDQGVRLIELRKDQLFSLSAVMGRIGDNPLKFIVFIDDLSFNKNDDNFSMLKAALEGSASAKAHNAVIYATSNRRHIVKETFSDRAAGDDVHKNDTMQELISLSDRFGLTVYYEKPNKALYLDIVRRLAEKAGVTLPAPELETRAEAFALTKGSRSPRAAEQFINSLL